jgi:hypothetical protein
MSFHGSRGSVYGSIASLHSSLLFSVLLIRIQPSVSCGSCPGFHSDTDADPLFNFDADSDAAYQIHAEPDPQQWR